MPTRPKQSTARLVLQLTGSEGAIQQALDNVTQAVRLPGLAISFPEPVRIAPISRPRKPRDKPKPVAV